MRCHFRKITTTAVLIAAAIPSLVAAEIQVSDLRLSGGFLARDFRGGATTTATDTGGGISTNSESEDGRDADQNWRGQLQYVAGHLGVGGGFLWGAGVAMNSASWDNGAREAHVTTPTVNILLGYGYGITPNWHVELTPFAGYGRAYYSVTENSSTETSKEWDSYVEFGAKVATYIALEEHLLLGIEIPYLMGRFDPEYTYTDETKRRLSVSDKRSNQGFGALASIGYRF